MTTTQASLRVKWQNVAALRDMQRLDGSNAALAAAMGVDESTVSRVMSGKSQPGPTFIAALCLALGTTRIDDLFEVRREEAAA